MPTLRPSTPPSLRCQVVKVCDFGVARLLPASVDRNSLEAQAQQTRSDMTAETGTYRWMAPEVRILWMVGSWTCARGAKIGR